MITIENSLRNLRRFNDSPANWNLFGTTIEIIDLLKTTTNSRLPKQTIRNGVYSLP